MKTTTIACCLLLAALDAGAQSWNPYVNQGIVSPAPLQPWEFSGTGVLSFNVGNTGSSPLPVTLNQEMTLVITLSDGIPNNVDPLAALGGTWVDKFDWTYDALIKTYRAKQNQVIPGSALGTITIQYKVTNDTPLSVASNGFNVNLQPPPYSNGYNATDDDAVSSYTYVQAKDYGDAPASYGTAVHTVDIFKDLGTGLYRNYMFLGAVVDPDAAYQASTGAGADDASQTGGLGADDEDGVAIPTLITGATVVIPVGVTIMDEGDPVGRLNAWFDWNGDGDFLDAGERVATNTMVFTSGTVPLSVTVPANANTAAPTYARFRFGSSLSSPSAAATYGEVEDYQVTIMGPQTSSISGSVYAGATPLGSVTLTLLDVNGNPVDGNPGQPGIQPITTVTNGSGYYVFANVPAGTYQVAQTQPFGYNSFGDADGGDLNIVGDVTPIVILPGQNSVDNNFIETVDTCPDNWDEWKFQHPGETPAGNPDADAYDNFAEFAFAMPYDSGVGSGWLDNTAWIIRPSTLAPGTIEGVFVRPKGAPLNTTYTLQYAAALGNPTVWQSLVITQAMTSTADNGDCTETVTIHGLEALTHLTGGEGFVRIKAVLDDDGGNDGEIDHTSYTEVEGWTETNLEICCQTYNNPYLRETVFTGTVAGVSGQDLTFTGEALGTLLTPGVAYYLEVTSGDHEGQRFDVVSASGATIKLANDSDVWSVTPPFNTLEGALPSTLAGDTVAIHRHWTLGELFPIGGFVAGNAHTTSDQVQTYAAGAWTTYWLYDEGDANPATAHWVKVGDDPMTNQAATVIAPGQGLFVTKRTVANSLLAYGEIRDNDFVRPLDAGANLVGGGYPITQSPRGPGSRGMNLDAPKAAGFFGSVDFKTADSIFIWKGDATIGGNGYETYFLLSNTDPAALKWVKVGDATLLSRDAEPLFVGDRAAFIRAKLENHGYTVPSPWTP